MYARLGVGLLVITLIGGGLWFVFSRDAHLIGGFTTSGFVASAALATTAEGEPYLIPPLENEYKNQKLRFALSVPEGFRVGELPDEEGGAKTILLQDSDGNGIQIYITPFPSGTRVLTVEQVRRDIPDMAVTDVQTVEVGENYQGIAFLSDNEAFNGASREVWFVFHGNLYQISTYARLDPLLQSMFATWRFF